MWIVRLGAAALISLLPLSAQEVRVTRGAADHQVFQRNVEGHANILIGGSVSGRKVNGKMVQARLSGKTGTLPGFDWIPLAKIQKGTWSGELARVPTGGPYKLEVRMEGASFVYAVNQLLVGDLWVLAGQSNMEGLGDLVDVQPPSDLVNSFNMADHWELAKEPLHTLVSATDPVHWPPNEARQPEQFTGEKLATYVAERKKGGGLGLPFAEEMVKMTGIPIGLIPCAHGGTSMDQWNPALKGEGGESLYGSMLRRFRAAGGNVKGILWYQGESDANPKSAAAFEKKFTDFVNAVRSDFGEPNLPFYYVQIGRHINSQNQTEWNAVQQAQLHAEPGIANSGMAVAVDLSLDDSIHVGTQDLKRLGHRLAKRACHDLFSTSASCGKLKPGPRPVSAIFDHGVIKVSFTNVNGSLSALGRISGFSVHDASGLPVAIVYRATIDPAEASTVNLYMQGNLPDQATLFYGYGKDPYCNLHDAEDMAMPAFGPMPIQRGK